MDPGQQDNDEASPVPETASNKSGSACETTGGYCAVIVTLIAMVVIGTFLKGFLPGPCSGFILLLAGGMIMSLIGSLLLSLLRRLQKSDHRTRSSRRR